MYSLKFGMCSHSITVKLSVQEKAQYYFWTISSIISIQLLITWVKTQGGWDVLSFSDVLGWSMHLFPFKIHGKCLDHVQIHHQLWSSLLYIRSVISYLFLNELFQGTFDGVWNLLCLLRESSHCRVYVCQMNVANEISHYSDNGDNIFSFPILLGLGVI